MQYTLDSVELVTKSLQSTYGGKIKAVIPIIQTSLSDFEGSKQNRVYFGLLSYGGRNSNLVPRFNKTTSIATVSKSKNKLTA